VRLSEPLLIVDFNFENNKDGEKGATFYFSLPLTKQIVKILIKINQKCLEYLLYFGSDGLF
jgi:hypothetical protein